MSVADPATDPTRVWTLPIRGARRHVCDREDHGQQRHVCICICGIDRFGEQRKGGGR